MHVVYQCSLNEASGTARMQHRSNIFAAKNTAQTKPQKKHTLQKTPISMDTQTTQAVGKRKTTQHLKTESKSLLLDVAQ